MTSDFKTQLLYYQKEWAYQKYWVMAHSQQHYNALRELFKGNEWSLDKTEQFEQLIAEASLIEPTVKTLRTAYQHVWGYFKKIATEEELAAYKRLERTIEDNPEALLLFLREMTEKYQPSYLVQSRIIHTL